MADRRPPPRRWLIRDGCPESPEVEWLLGMQKEDVLAEARQLLQLLDRVRPVGRGRNHEGTKNTRVHEVAAS